MKFSGSKNGMRRFCVAILLLFLFASIFVSPGFAMSRIEVTVNSSKVIGTNRLETGIYIGSHDTGKFKDSSAFRGLARDANVKMVAFMENRLWEVPHPCTRFPDRWNWRGMDELIRGIFEIGAEPFITLGFCYRDGVRVPAGMAGRNTAGYATPTPEEWGAYCAEWVKHFKEAGLPVRYFDIMHEAHQYYDWKSSLDVNKMNYIISLFNAAATEMRRENPNILIGNDDAMMDWVLPHYISKAETLDFFCWHRYLTGSKSESDSSLIRKAEFDEGGDKGPDNFIDPARRKYYDSKGVWLPAIQAGGNLNYAYTRGTDSRLQTMMGATCLALSLKMMMLKGVEYNSIYTFAGKGTDNFGIVNVDTAEPYYPYYVYRMVGPNLGRGDSIVESSSGATEIATVAWLHDGKLNVLLVNKANREQDVTLDGITGELKFQKIDSTMSGLETGTIRDDDVISMNGYTVMLLQSDDSTPPPPPVYTCLYCGAEFNTQEELDEHILSEHSEQPPDSPTTIFEDDFESGDFNKWTGTTTSSGESVAVVDTLPHHGNHHGQFTSNGGSGREHAFCYKTVDGEELYARGYFYVARGLPLADDGDRFYFLRFRAGGQSLAGAGIRRNGGVDSWIIYARDGSGWIGPFYASSPVVEENDWYCVELHWKKDRSYGLAEMYVDGEKVLEVRSIDTANFGNVDEVDFGLISATNVQNSLTVRGDCFALSNTYIGPEVEVALFEDDFESGDFGKWTGTSTSSGETATVVDTRPHDGTFNGMFTSNGGGGVEYAYCHKTTDEEEAYARGDFYIASGLPLKDNDDRFYFLRFRAGGQSLVGVGIRRNNGVDKWIVYARQGSGWVGPIYAASPAVEMGRWYCIELHWKKHASQGLVELYVDGEKVLEITGIDTTYFGNVDTINFGLISATNVQNNLIVYGDCFICIYEHSESMFLKGKDIT